MSRALPLRVAWRIWIYRLAFPLVLLFLLPGMIRRMVRRGHFRRHLGQRFGYFSPELRERLQKKNNLWLQSISVGETQIALKIASRWLLQVPDWQVVISVTTSTGFDLAGRADDPRIHVIYNPIDLAGIVRRTLDVVQPASLVLVEGTWPVLLAETWRRRVPVSLVTRLSPRSARRFARFRGFTGPIFHLLDAVFTQEPEEKAVWQHLGARPEAIICSGAIKYDEPPHASPPNAVLAGILTNFGILAGTPILLAGSTFAGEEMILAQTYRRLKERFPALFLILVPRHVERTPEILRELEPLELKVRLRSRAQAESGLDILLVDTTGELRDWYQFATLVFVGKSLTSRGGQNPVEPVLQGKPVLFGPHMENFAPIVRQWLAAGAAIQVCDETDLAKQVETLLLDTARRAELPQKAITAISLHFGATNRVVEHLIQLKI